MRFAHLHGERVGHLGIGTAQGQNPACTVPIENPRSRVAQPEQ
jgi:hypothetical protein